MRIHLITLFAPRLDFYYIEDWIKHNISIGVDHIYFYNNGFNLASEPTAKLCKDSKLSVFSFGKKGCSGNISKKWDLKPFMDSFDEYSDEYITNIINEIDKKYPSVTFIPFEYNTNHLFKYPISQYEAMRHHIKQGIDSDYVGMLDIDEYINLPNHSSLEDWINEIDSDRTYDNIRLYERIQPRIGRESFTNNPNKNKKVGKIQKTLSKTSSLRKAVNIPINVSSTSNNFAWTHHMGCLYLPSTLKFKSYFKSYDCNEAYFNHYKYGIKNPRILCCILHTEKQPEQYEGIIETWGSRIDHMFYSDHEDMEKNIVKVSDRNDYLSCVEKMSNIFNILINDSRYNHYDYYFFVDNDTYINVTELDEFARNTYRDVDKIHGYIDVSPDGLEVPHGGAGFLMSKKLVEKFMDCKIYDCKYSDINLAYNAKEKGIEFESHYGLNSCRPKQEKIEDLNKWFKSWSKQITFHYIKGIDAFHYVQNKIREEYK